MQAFEEGKVIERLTPHGWEVVMNPAWDWLGNNYRVKPRERRKYWFIWIAAENKPTVIPYVDNTFDIAFYTSRGYTLLEEPLD